MQLTREQAIEEHRKMWNWIADQHENGELSADLKAKYIEVFFPGESILHHCFCCEYSRLSDNLFSCDSCPFNWGENLGINSHMCIDKYYEDDACGLYSLWLDEVVYGNPINAKILAREIADLPEREGV